MIYKILAHILIALSIFGTLIIPCNLEKEVKVKYSNFIISVITTAITVALMVKLLSLL